MKIRRRNRIRRPSAKQVFGRWVRRASKRQLQDYLNRTYSRMLHGVAVRDSSLVFPTAKTGA